MEHLLSVRRFRLVNLKRFQGYYCQSCCSDRLLRHISDVYGSCAGADVVESNVSIDELPIVAVLDTGVDFLRELEPLIVEHWVPTGAAPGDKKHGTNVASKVAFENLGRTACVRRTHHQEQESSTVTSVDSIPTPISLIVPTLFVTAL